MLGISLNLKFSDEIYFDQKASFLLKFNRGYKTCKYKIDKPLNYMKMIEISEEISKKFDFCRIDLYEINNKIYFGEITFVPGAAELSDSIRPKKYDIMVGSKWL